MASAGANVTYQVPAMSSELEKKVLRAVVQREEHLGRLRALLRPAWTRRPAWSNGLAAVAAAAAAGADAVDPERARQDAQAALDTAVVRAVVLLGELRRSTVEVCEAVVEWRRRFVKPPAYVYKGSNYLLWCVASLDFVDRCEPLLLALQFHMERNPLVVPSASTRATAALRRLGVATDAYAERIADATRVLAKEVRQRGPFPLAAEQCTWCGLVVRRRANAISCGRCRRRHCRACLDCNLGARAAGKVMGGKEAWLCFTCSAADEEAAAKAQAADAAAKAKAKADMARRTAELTGALPGRDSDSSEWETATESESESEGERDNDGDGDAHGGASGGSDGGAGDDVDVDALDGPGSRPESRPESRASRFSSRPGSRPGSRLNSRPSTRPGTREGSRPTTAASSDTAASAPYVWDDNAAPGGPFPGDDDDDAGNVLAMDPLREALLEGLPGSDFDVTVDIADALRDGDAAGLGLPFDLDYPPSLAGSEHGSDDDDNGGGDGRGGGTGAGGGAAQGALRAVSYDEEGMTAMDAARASAAPPPQRRASRGSRGSGRRRRTSRPGSVEGARSRRGTPKGRRAAAQGDSRGAVDAGGAERAHAPGVDERTMQVLAASAAVRDVMAEALAQVITEVARVAVPATIAAQEAMTTALAAALQGVGDAARAAGKRGAVTLAQRASDEGAGSSGGGAGPVLFTRRAAARVPPSRRLGLVVLRLHAPVQHSADGAAQWHVCLREAATRRSWEVTVAAREGVLPSHEASTLLRSLRLPGSPPPSARRRRR